jgi:hypothetical protein
MHRIAPDDVIKVIRRARHHVQTSREGITTAPIEVVSG